MSLTFFSFFFYWNDNDWKLAFAWLADCDLISRPNLSKSLYRWILYRILPELPTAAACSCKCFLHQPWCAYTCKNKRVVHLFSLSKSAECCCQTLSLYSKSITFSSVSLGMPYLSTFPFQLYASHIMTSPFTHWNTYRCLLFDLKEKWIINHVVLGRIHAHQKLENSTFDHLEITSGSCSSMNWSGLNSMFRIWDWKHSTDSGHISANVWTWVHGTGTRVWYIPHGSTLKLLSWSFHLDKAKKKMLMIGLAIAVWVIQKESHAALTQPAYGNGIWHSLYASFFFINNHL